MSSFFFPTYGYGYAPSYGVPVSSGGGFGSLLLWGFVAFAVISVAQNVLSQSGSSGVSLGGGSVGVAKLQIGLLGTARDLKADLDRIAKRADTSSSEGLHYVLQETVLALLRNPEYCVYGAAEVKSARGLDDGEERFNQLSLEERGKIEQETLVNVSGRTRQGSYSRGGRSSMDELIVVTILAAVDGGIKMPKVNSREELRTALNRLGALRSDQVLALEVLWTPQDERDSYSRDDMFSDYPTLHTL